LSSGGLQGSIMPPSLLQKGGRTVRLTSNFLWVRTLGVELFFSFSKSINGRELMDFSP
jgi:hypothetical protein